MNPTTEHAEPTPTASSDDHISPGLLATDLATDQASADEDSARAASSTEGVSVPPSAPTPTALAAPTAPTAFPARGASKRRPVLWAGMLGAGAVGAAGVALWPRQDPAASIAQARPTARAGATSTLAPKDSAAASPFDLPGRATPPPAMAPLFPGLGQPRLAQPGAPGAGAKGAGAVDTPGSRSPFAPLGGLPAGAGPGKGKPGSPGAASLVAAPVQAAFGRAVAAQKAGRADEAVQAYREVLRLKPDAVEARANLAVLFAAQKQPDRAVEQLREARKVAPRQPAILFPLAQALLQAKRPAEAVEPLQAVVKADPRSPAPQLLLAQVLSELKRSKPALAAWERLCALDPKNGAAALAAGAMALEGTREPARAVRWLRKAVALPPADPRKPLMLGRALIEAKQPREAAAVLKKGFEQFPAVTEMGTMLADARVASGDLKGAAGTLREVIKRVPESQGGGAPAGQLHVALARLLATQKSFGPAQSELEEAARLLPREADVRGLSIDMALRSGDWQRAASSLDAMITIDPKRLPARVLVAREAARRKQLGLADSQYAKYLQQKPGDAGAVAERAVVLEKMGRTDDADAQWKRAIVLLPDSPLPGLQRARALRQAGRDQAALDAFRFVLQNWSSDPNALLEAATLEMKLGQPARAAARWRALIGVKPAFEPAYAALLEASRQVDQLSSALGFLKQQAARNPERDALYEAVLNVHARLGQAREGRAWVANIARLYPSARAPKRALALFTRRFPSLAQDEPAATPRPTAAPKPTSTAPSDTPAAPASEGAAPRSTGPASEGGAATP